LKRAVSGKEEPVDWSVVAKEVGYGLEKTQCKIRWRYKLKPVELGVKEGGEWTTDEVRIKAMSFSTPSSRVSSCSSLLTVAGQATCTGGAALNYTGTVEQSSAEIGREPHRLDCDRGGAGKAAEDLSRQMEYAETEKYERRSLHTSRG